MHGKIVQPEMPRLLAHLPLWRIAMLVQRFQIPEDARDFFASDTKLLGLYESLPQSKVSVEAGGLGRTSE